MRTPDIWLQVSGHGLKPQPTAPCGRALCLAAHAPHPGGLSSTATTDGRRCKSRRQRRGRRKI